MKKTTRKRKRSNQNNAVNPNDGIKAYFIAASKSDEEMEMENEPNEVNDENNGHIDLDIKMIGTKTKKTE